jgi:hypothetical protein
VGQFGGGVGGGGQAQGRRSGSSGKKISYGMDRRNAGPAYSTQRRHARAPQRPLAPCDAVIGLALTEDMSGDEDDD